MPDEPGKGVHFVFGLNLTFAKVDLLDFSEVSERGCAEGFGGVVFVEGLCRGDGRVGSEVGGGCEASIHEGGGGIVLVHRGDGEDAVDGFENAGLVVEIADEASLSGVGAGDEADGAVSIDVVGTGLRVIFVDEDCGFAPEFRF